MNEHELRLSLSEAQERSRRAERLVRELLAAVFRGGVRLDRNLRAQAMAVAKKAHEGSER